jgi:hypothetical protein
MESSPVFPPSEACEHNSVPDGYPYVCPRCSTCVPGVYWDASSGEFLYEDDLATTAILADHLYLFRVSDGGHSVVSVFHVLHEC